MGTSPSLRSRAGNLYTARSAFRQPKRAEIQVRAAPRNLLSVSELSETATGDRGPFTRRLPVDYGDNNPKYADPAFVDVCCESRDFQLPHKYPPLYKLPKTVGINRIQYENTTCM